MADRGLELDIFRDLLEDVDLASQLAKDQKSFQAVYQAFRSLDVKAFHEALVRLDLVGRCRLVCEWLRIKECIFRCIELCGPPKVFDKVPDPRRLAEAIVQLTAEEKNARELADAVQEGHRDVLERLITAHKLEPFCHLFCHWICLVHYRLVCHWLCSGGREERPELSRDLRSAGIALRKLLEHKNAFEEAVAASDAGDAEKLGAILRAAGLVQHCHLICEWFCSWRCALACLTLCRQFPIPAIKQPVEEAFEFAVALGHLATKATELERLSIAVGRHDVKTFAGLVEKLELQRFYFQLCHWLCFRWCRRFCILVCPPIFNHPWFTHVGDFGIYSDIDPADGLTNKKQAGHGGPNFGFFGGIRLRGFCPKYDPAHPVEQMAYRFLYQPSGGSATPIAGGFVSEVLVGTRYTFWNGNPFALQSVRIRGAGATSPTPPPPGPGLTPPDHYIVPDGQGWVRVDSMALDDGFNGPLMGFATGVAFPGGNPAPGVSAGTAVPAANQKNGFDVAIIFQATRVSTLASVNAGGAPDYTNQLAKIHINNWNEVNLIDVAQLSAGGCLPLNNDLDIQYTTDHELLAAWSIDVVTAAPIGPQVFPSGVGPRGAAGTDHHDITSWPPCSYLVRLHTRRSLTDGINDDLERWNFKTFCIGNKKPK